MAQKKSHFKMVMNPWMRKFLCQELSPHAGIAMAQVRWKMVVAVRHIVVANAFAVRGMTMCVIVGKVDRLRLLTY